MMKTLCLLLIVAGIVGCSSEPDAGVANTEPRKTADQLPADMPPEARAQAEGAMSRGAAMEQAMQKGGPPPQARVPNGG